MRTNHQRMELSDFSCFLLSKDVVSKIQYEIEVQIGVWDFSKTTGTIFFVVVSFFFCYLCDSGTFRPEMATRFFLVHGENFAALTALPSGERVRSPSPASRAG